MSARERGLRVVLIAPKHEPGREMAAALADIARVGWTLAAIVCPEQAWDAVHMVTGGLADLVVVSRPELSPVHSPGRRPARPRVAVSGRDPYAPAAARRPRAVT